MRQYGWLIAAAFLFTSCSGATFKFIKHLAPNITDHEIFDGVDLEASAEPFQFEQRKENIELPAPYLWVEDKEVPEEWTATDLFEKKGCTAFMVVKGDSIMYEWYGRGYARDKYSQVFSVTKSWTSALIGIAIDEGHIKSVHQPVTDFLEDFATKDEDKEKITLYHLLNMTSGLAFDDYKTLSKLTKLYYCNVHEKQCNDIKAKYEPGDVWAYKSISTLILGLCLEKAVKMPVADYLRIKLWEPMNMENNGFFAHDKNGVAKTYGGLSLTAVDLAKFGRLYKNRGNWNGEQLVPEAWVDSIRNRNFSHGVWNYSYQFWLDTYPRNAAHETGDFFAGGYRGQVCYVSPEEDIVIIRLGVGEKKLRWPYSLSKLALLLAKPGEVTEDELPLIVDGSYTNKKGRQLKVKLKDNKVTIEPEDNVSYELEMVSVNNYRDRVNNVNLVWNKDRKGFILEDTNGLNYFAKASAAE